VFKAAQMCRIAAGDRAIFIDNLRLRRVEQQQHRATRDLSKLPRAGPVPHKPKIRQASFVVANQACPPYGTSAPSVKKRRGYPWLSLGQSPVASQMPIHHQPASLPVMKADCGVHLAGRSFRLERIGAGSQGHTASSSPAMGTISGHHHGAYRFNDEIGHAVKNRKTAHPFRSDAATPRHIYIAHSHCP